MLPVCGWFSRIVCTNSMVTKSCVRTSKTTWQNKHGILSNYRQHCLRTAHRKCNSEHVIQRDLQGDSQYSLRRRDWRGNRKTVAARTVQPWKNGDNGSCSSKSRIRILTDMPIKKLNKWTSCFISGHYCSNMNLKKLAACMNKHRNCIIGTKAGNSISTSNILNCCYFHIGQCLNGQTRTIHTLARMCNTRDCCLSLNLSGQEISLNSVGKRNKSSESFLKRLANKFFQDKTLQAKVDNLKAAEAKLSALKVQQDMKPTKALIGELLYGCSSSKHLLDFIAPWIETGKVTLDEVVTVIEQLQYLVYTEMKEPYPNFVYGCVTDMYYNLKLMHVDDTVFSAIHGHVAFRAMCEYLKLETAALTKAQFASCFSCLLHLGISRFDGVMTRFYTRLMDTDHEGYSLIDIMHLSNISHLHSSPVSLTAEYVHPKLSECLKVIESQAMDLKPLRAILYILSDNFKRPLRQEETVCLYSQLYKCCTETGCLDDLSSASELLGFLYRQFIVHKHFLSSVPVYFKLNEIHGENIIQKMLDLCLAKVAKNIRTLTPLDIYFLSFMRMQDTRLHKLVDTRVKFLLEHRMDQLSLPELIWLLSMYVRFNPEPKIIAVIRERLNALDLPNLALFLRCVQVTETSCDIIGKKIIDFVDDIFNHEQILHSTLKFDWAIWIKCRHSFNMDFLDDAFQEHLPRVYKESYIGLRKSYAVTVLMTLLRRRQLQSSSVHLLNKLSADGSIFKNLKPGQIYVILKELTVSASEGGQVCDLLSNDADKALYESFIFLTLFKTLAAFYRSFDLFRNPNIYLISKTMECLYMHSKIDVLVQDRVLERISSSTIQGIDELIKTCHCFNRIDIMRERNNPYRQQFLNNLVTFAINNSDIMSVHDWATVSNVLAHYGYYVDKNEAFLKLLENTIVKEFAVDSSFLSFLIDCWSLGVDMSKALKIIFSKEYLHALDRRVFIDKDMSIGSTKRQLFDLNTIACMCYPSLKVAWVQDADYVAKWNYKSTGLWEFFPKDLSEAIDKIAGGERFVGKYFFLDYGIPVWRALLIDEDNQPVEFTEQNLKMASEMKYKRFIFEFVQQSLDLYLRRRYTCLERCGHSIIIVHQSEWYSLGLPTIDDKVELLRKKLSNNLPTSVALLPDRPLVNCESISTQWKHFLNGNEFNPANSSYENVHDSDSEMTVTVR